jgi:cyclopropane-fatty-acyl-phospholipid synthase
MEAPATDFPAPESSPSPALARYKALVRRIFGSASQDSQETFKESFKIRFWDGEVIGFGGGDPQFTIVLRGPRALRAVDEDSVAAGFYDGDWDIEGDARTAFALRKYLSRKPALLERLALVGRIFFVSDTRNNKKAVEDHYSLGDEFYLSFIDRKYRVYSHGHFRSDDESLEQGQDHKLEDMFQMLGLAPGMRLLDIGGGWGAVPQYCGERGVHVTSLTLAPDSQRFIQRLIDERQLPCRVLLEDFLDHRPEKPYDAVVIFGVIEHIPQYKRFVQKTWDILKREGLMYLDASASRLKYNMGTITKKHIWTTTCAYLSLHDLIAELNYNGMSILEVKNESRDYELTMLHWARRFEAAKAEIVERWGERVYRMFLLYLWGGHVNFGADSLQAYRILIRRGGSPGPRPSLLHRAWLAAHSAW